MCTEIKLDKKTQLEKIFIWELWCFAHVCSVPVTILKLVWCSRRADEPWCTHFPSDICSVIQEGEITVEKCTHPGASACRERHTLSLMDETNMDITTVHLYMPIQYLWSSMIWIKKYIFKGIVSWDGRGRLLYIFWKLSLNAIAS